MGYIKKHIYPNKILIIIPETTSFGKCTPHITLLIPIINARTNIKSPKYVFIYKQAIAIIKALAVCLLGNDLPFPGWKLIIGVNLYISYGRVLFL